MQAALKKDFSPDYVEILYSRNKSFKVITEMQNNKHIVPAAICDFIFLFLSTTSYGYSGLMYIFKISPF